MKRTPSNSAYGSKLELLPRYSLTQCYINIFMIGFTIGFTIGSPSTSYVHSASMLVVFSYVKLAHRIGTEIVFIHVSHVAR